MKSLRTVVLGSIPFLAIGLLWYMISKFSWAPQWIIPSPLDTARTFLDLVISGQIIRMAWVSLQNAFIGFLLAAIAGIVLGAIVGSNQNLRKIFLPFLSAVYVIPSIAWLPLLIIFVGFTKTAVVALIFMSSFKRIIYSVIGGVRSVNENWVLAGKNIGLTRIEIIFKIIIPASFPHIITGLRLGFGSAWRSLVGAEMLIGGINGLGRFVWNSQWFFAFDQVFSGIIVIGLVGVVVEQLIFRSLENRTLVKWGLISEEE